MDVNTNKDIQTLLAQEIFIKHELQKRGEELKAALLNSKVLHKNDLLTFAITKTANAEEQLEVAHEQIETLKRELHDANRKLESYCQELDNCNKEIVSLETEVWKMIFSDNKK